MWARSWWRSRKEIETDLLPRDSAIPFAIVTTAIVIGAPSDGARAVAIGGLVFYASALLALAFSQLARSGKTVGALKAGDIVVTLLVSTVIATLLGVLVFGVLFGIAVDLLEPVVTGPVADGVEFVLIAVFTPIAWLLEVFFSWLLGNIGDTPVEIGDEITTTSEDDLVEQTEPGDSEGWPHPGIRRPHRRGRGSGRRACARCVDSCAHAAKPEQGAGRCLRDRFGWEPWRGPPGRVQLAVSASASAAAYRDGCRAALLGHP